MFLRKDILFSLTIVLSISNVNQGVYQSQTKISDYGFQFQPVNYPDQILSTFIIQNNLLKSCFQLCNENILCRIFDINGVILNQCRLFQGDINIHGIIISSLINNAQVGTIQFFTKLYLNYGQSCSSNSEENRYLTCGMNSTWQCPQNAYWNQLLSMCLAQSPLLGSICQQNMSMCREDLNYTCLRFNQCGPLSLLIGTTLLNSTTPIAYSSTVGLNQPTNIQVNKPIDNSIIVANSARSQVIRFYDNGLSISNASVIPHNWSAGNLFFSPFATYVEPNQKLDLYVSDPNNYCVFKLFIMQAISPLPIVVAGVKGSPGNGTNLLRGAAQIAVDSNGNIYVCDFGNSQGRLNNQLSFPRDIYISKKTKAMYISDSGNNRIQRWNQGDQSGVTIAGDPNGNYGTNSTMLRNPYGIALNDEETFLYVADSLNNRIQRFQIV